MTDFTMTKDAEGIATIIWDVKAKSMNVMTLDAWPLLEVFVDDALADADVKGIIITSGKDSFAGGMDLNVIAKMKEMAGDDPAKGLFDGIMNAHRELPYAGDHDLPVSEWAQDRHIVLPLFPTMDDDDIDAVVAALRDAVADPSTHTSPSA